MEAVATVLDVLLTKDVHTSGEDRLVSRRSKATRMTAMSSNFSRIVNINGFACRNTGDVGYAKRFIDPARPAAGAFGLNLPEPVAAAPQSPAQRARDSVEVARRPSASRPTGLPAAPKPVGESVDKLA